MNLIKQNTPNCLLASFAMVLDTNQKTLLDEIEYTGLEEWWPDCKPPYNLRGHHIQEMIDCCWRRGYSITPISVMPASAPAGMNHRAKRIWESEFAENRFFEYIRGRKGVLIGESVAHACAWDGYQVYDPNGNVYELEHFQVKEIWLLSKMESNQV